MAYQKWICAGLLLSSLSTQAQNSVLHYVQPLVGTSNSTTIAATKHGQGTEQLANTIPAVGVPFGMTQWTPQTQNTEQKCIAPYYYKDQRLSGFRATHWLSGSCTQDYGSVTLMPITGKLNTNSSTYATSLEHADEITAPNYYRIQLKAYHLKAEMTATARSGMLRFTMSAADSLYVLIKPNSDKEKGFIRINKARNEITGYNPAYRIYQGIGTSAGFSGYFVIQLSRPLGVGGVFDGRGHYQKDSISSIADIGAYIGFKLQKGEQLIVKAGTSFTSIEEARKNLDAEIKGWDFDAVKQQSAVIWEKALQRIQVNGSNEKDKHIFYTALYHTMQAPRLFNDADGTYPLFDHSYKKGKLLKGNYYDDFSMWDIYRAELPLYEILDPGVVNDMARSIVMKGEQGGWLPIFPCWNNYTGAMVGDHAIAFLASAWLKGINDFNITSAYRLMRRNAFEIPPIADYKKAKGRRALAAYIKYGYVPLEEGIPEAFHKNEQVSRTLEYAYDDYALAMVAKKSGKQADYNLLIKRALNYRHVFDPAVAFMNGRHTNGSWYSPFTPDKKVSFITEGTPRQYTFYVPQDVYGLANLMGGKAKLEQQLDSLFIKGEYWHGNEPGHHISFMYNYTNAPWKTQRQVHRILQDEYTDGPGGLSGNDDAGQMSAWCVFAMVGMYPVNPVSGEYVLSSPVFNRAVIMLPAGKKLQIITHKTTADAIYIKQIKLNGHSYTKNYLSYNHIMKGGQLEIYLQNTPQKNWGTAVDNQPRSLSKIQ